MQSYMFLAFFEVCSNLKFIRVDILLVSFVIDPESGGCSREFEFALHRIAPSTCETLLTSILNTVAKGSQSLCFGIVSVFCNEIFE